MKRIRAIFIGGTTPIQTKLGYGQTGWAHPDMELEGYHYFTADGGYSYLLPSEELYFPEPL